MPLQSSGQISMSEINDEFGLGYDLNSYRGTIWYTYAGGAGYFSGGQISMAEFFGKRASGPGGCTFCCFTPDTPITMADGSTKPIGEIQAGDMILSRDEATGLDVLATVTGVITRTDREMYEFALANGTVLRASEDHPLYVQGKGWASVRGYGDYKDLDSVNVIAVGDRVIGVDGISIEILSIAQIDYPGTVYTLENSRFYANGVFVY